MFYSKSLPPLPPPYADSPSNASGSPSISHNPTLHRPPTSFAPHQRVTSPDMPSRSHTFPGHPEPWVDDPLVAQVTASMSQFPSQVTGSTLSSRSITATSSSMSLAIPPFPPPPMPSDINFSFPTPSRAKSLGGKSRSAFPLSASKISKATRNATAWIAEHAARKGSVYATYENEPKKGRAVESEAAALATKIRSEDPWKAGVQAQVREAVKSSIRSWLTLDIPNEESDAVFQKCRQICTNGGLDLSAVLQEPLIDGKPPVYWAILNGTTSLQSSDAALHALVLSFLERCEPLKETTIASIRLACMLTSNNTLLQHLFWHFPALSPLTRSDAMLLSSAAGGDIVEVNETQDGTGTFVARIQIRRFRLRMRVSKLIKVEFVTAGRPA